MTIRPGGVESSPEFRLAAVLWVEGGFESRGVFENFP